MKHGSIAATPPPGRRNREAGFLLLEIMLAVLIFTVGVIALGTCMTNCINAQEIRNQEERARVALENRMVEIQASPAMPDNLRKTQLKGMFSGMTMIERRATLNVQNEDNVALSDLHEVTLTAEWTSREGRMQSRTLAFTLLRGRN